MRMQRKGSEMSDDLVKRLLGTKSMKIMLDRIEALEAENDGMSEACAKWAEVSQGNYRRAKDAEAERDALRAALAKADELAGAVGMMTHRGVIWHDDTEREFQAPLKTYQDAVDALTAYRQARDATR